VHRVVGEADFLSGRTIELLTQAVIAEIDVAKVERIVENLLVNAAKHTPVSSPIWWACSLERRAS